MRPIRVLSVGILAVALLSGCAASGSAPSSAGDATAAPSTTGVALPDGWHSVAGEDTPTAQASPELPTTVEDGTGTEVVVDDIDRIIVGGDDVADILGALGLGDRVYAAPEDGASEYAAAAPVQFAFSQETGTEGLLSVDGTLFIGNNPRRHADVAQQFRDAGVDAVVYDDQQPTADKIREVARYVGDAEAGEEIATRVEEQLAEAGTHADALDGVRILQVTSSGAGGANAVVGTGTAGADVIEAIGATSVGVEAGLRGYSREYSDEGLLDTEPDVILLGTADLEEWGGLEGFADAFPTLLDTPAAQNGQIYVMPSTQIKVSGPSLGTGALALAEALTTSLDAAG